MIWLDLPRVVPFPTPFQLAVIMTKAPVITQRMYSVHSSRYSHPSSSSHLEWEPAWVQSWILFLDCFIWQLMYYPGHMLLLTVAVILSYFRPK